MKKIIPYLLIFILAFINGWWARQQFAERESPQKLDASIEKVNKLLEEADFLLKCRNLAMDRANESMKEDGWFEIEIKDESNKLWFQIFGQELYRRQNEEFEKIKKDLINDF